MANKIIIALLTAILGLQAWTLIRQYGPTMRGVTTKQQPVKDSKAQMSTEGLPSLGDSASRVAMVEFSDFECPFCERYAREIAPILQSQFVQTGKVRYFFAHNPLPNHRNARLLALSAVCAGESKFWQMHNRLFKEKPASIEDVLRIGQELGFGNDSYRSCISNPKDLSKRIEADMEVAVRLGLQATPAFAIGSISNGQISVSKIIIGAQPVEVFATTLDATIESALRSN